MLLSLAVRNFVIVDELALEFAQGFTVLTGETGAGKSILIDALQMALGERAEADVLRDGAQRAEISAEFRPNAAACDWLRAAVLEGDDDRLLLRRVVDAGGRSKAFINGMPVTLSQLRELGELLVDVHGQHAHQSLLRPAAQLQLLDEHGGLTGPARAVAEQHAHWRRAVRAREQAAAMAAAAQLEEQQLRWMVEELTALAPQRGEWEAVETEHRRLSHAASLLDGAQAAVAALADADDAALGRVDAARSRLAALASYDDQLQPVLQALDTARIHLDDAARTLRHYSGRMDVDERRIAEVEARVTALHAAARKFKSLPAELPALLADAQARLAALAASNDMDTLRHAERAAEHAYRRTAQALSEARADAASAMGRDVTRAMQDLALPGGRFEVRLLPGEPAASGLERVEFLVAGHPGVAPKPLTKVASGGELARVGLAISVIAVMATPVATLIFDEVDAGIGGAVAETVGRLLAQLGHQRQVLAVTHLPQVAARGDQHYVVGKQSDQNGRPVTHIAALDRRGRIEELARMLGGIEITETTRKHAQEMLAA